MTGAGAQAGASGHCLCGAVRYRVTGPLRGVLNCHCNQCRRTHGHVAAYTRVAQSDLELLEARGLKWFQSSPKARRGFCQDCGASLFWEAAEGDTISIAAGTLDQPSGLDTLAEIFTAEAGDYYELHPGLEAFPGTSGDLQALVRPADKPTASR